MESRFAPMWLLHAALALTLGAAFAFTRGWLWAAVAMLLLSTPLDLVARRLGVLRLRPIAPQFLCTVLLWPAGGLAMLALGWWETRHGSGWGAFVCAIAAAAFGQAYQLERAHTDIAIPPWLVSRRNVDPSCWLLFAIAERLDRLPDRRARLCRHFLLFCPVFGASAAVRIDAALTSIR